MQLFDTQIAELETIIANNPFRELNITDQLLKDAGKNNMVFSDESAYELGGGDRVSLSYELASSKRCEDKILLLGDDLSKIKEDVSFIRIAILEVEDEKIKSDELYDRLEKIKFTKYRVSPEGYMLRTATGNHEKVRVSKKAAASSFANIGSAYLKAYHLLPYVKHVTLLFITGESGLYEKLLEIGNRKTEITQALDHMLKGILLNDCNTCSVKELCDAVEGMRQFHENT